MGATGKGRIVATMSLALLVGLLVLQMTAVLARADPEEVGGNVVEALRLLEHLDKYYSHVNRPRFGRSVPVRFSGGSMSSTSDEYER
ncbi:neuropeptide F-like [Dermacentor silvarum]|uniref:neuropeptide F-like n=1 Tax=Dermacentor silvarum TaxID=543639 RepID=UPI001898D81C|nr:neuropeptide F-like [Dermacentor silvarum]